MGEAKEANVSSIEERLARVELRMGPTDEAIATALRGYEHAIRQLLVAYEGRVERLENEIEMLKLAVVRRGDFAFYGMGRPAKNADEPSITCPKCRMTSHHPEDVRQRFCGNCHAFVDDQGR